MNLLIYLGHADAFLMLFIELIRHFNFSQYRCQNDFDENFSSALGKASCFYISLHSHILAMSPSNKK